MHRLSKVLLVASMVATSSAELEILSEEESSEGDDGYAHYYIPHEGNSTLSATFSIQVTPEHYHMLSWLILWLLFVGAVAFGMHQIRLERQWLRYVLTTLSTTNKGSNARSQSNSRLRKYSVVGGGSPVDPEQGGGRPLRYVRSNNRGVGNNSRLSLSSSAASLTNTSNPGNLGDEQAISNGDLARATFRRLLLIALMSRTMAIPIQVYSDPLWVQLIADTFPVMTYATAWTWLVSFFIQLVCVALGVTTNIGNTINANVQGSARTQAPNSLRPAATIETVLQITAYSVYVLLIVAFSIFRRIAAAVLLYALLCCVYATLLGTALYFCPQLVGLVLPALEGKWKSPLAIRLLACSSASLLVFATQTFLFARKVVQSTTPVGHNGGGGPYWWLQYGALELLPGIIFLVLLHPKKPSPPPSAETSPSQRTPPYLKRSDSSDSKSNRTSTPPPKETAPLLGTAAARYDDSAPSFLQTTNDS